MQGYQIPTNTLGIDTPNSLREGPRLHSFEHMWLRQVSQGQICTTARRDTKYVVL